MPRRPRIGASGLRSENDPPLLVLMSLADGPKHGHGLILDIEGFTQVRLGPGTLYGAINKLEAEGLIEALPPEGRRRPYRITDAGAESLAREVARLKALAATGERRIAILRPSLGTGL